MEEDAIDDALIDAYLDRLGLSRSVQPTRAGLDLLVDRHLSRVPFENIDIFEKQPVELGKRRAVEKVVRRRHGGFCFELNEAFRALLAALGYHVRRIEGRVWLNTKRQFGAPFDHLALVVSLPEGDYLVDVGFGDNNRRPMRLPQDEVSDVSGRYRLRPGRKGFVLLERLAQNGHEEPQPLCEMTLGTQHLASYGEMCAYHQSSPDSIFTKGLIGTLPTPGGRITLTQDRLIRLENGSRSERTVADGRDRDALLRAHFGIILGPSAPTRIHASADRRSSLSR